MTSVLSDCLRVIAEKFLDLTIGEARYLCCFNTIVEEHEREKGKLRAKRKGVMENVNVAKNRAEEIVNDVTVWIQNADNIINDNNEMKRTCFSGWCINCMWQYQRGKELAVKTLEIAELKELNFESVGRAGKLPGVEYHSSQDFIEFESRTSQHKQLLEALKNEENYMVGLHGMGGTGKTTLVQKVGNEVKRSNFFDEVIFTTVSHAPDIRKIQDNIATPLGLKLEEGDQLQRAKKLWSRLTNGERILVILDDVWEELKFEDIGIPSCNNHNACRVLITSRMMSVCNSMSCQSTIDLELLSEEDAKILFEKHTGLRDESPKNLKKLAQQIANECKRSPVAITAIAKSLKHQPPELWKVAYKSLKEFKQIRNVDEDLKIYKCFQVSYENLKDEKAKKLFMLCSLFPEDYEIRVEDLTIFGKGLGIFGDVDSYEAARIEMLTAKRKLLDACLLLKGQEGCVKMHDLVRDAAHWIGNYEIQVIMGSKVHATAKKGTITYLYCQNVKRFCLPNQLDCTKIKILIILCLDKEGFVEMPQAFFEETKDLEVLAISKAENIRGKPSLALPRSIETLKNIRTLCLRGFNLGDISILQKLEILETLELSDCSIIRLPKGMVKLEKLRLLALTCCAIEKNHFEVIGRLSQLEELYVMRSPDRFRWKFDKEVVATIFDRDNIIPTLQRYHIQIGHDSGLYHSVDDSISRALSIEYFDPNSNATIKDLVERAEILHLKRIQGNYTTVTPQLVEAIGGEMNDLINLKLEFCSKIECLIDTNNFSSSIGSIFSKLVKIEIRGMDNLKELCHGPPPSDIFGNLQEMSIYLCHQLHGRLFEGNLNLGRITVFQVEYCRMLTSMFTPSTAASLVLLEELVIEGCKELRNLISYEEEENKQEQIVQHDDNDQKIYGSIFPKLRTFDLRMCDQLEYIITRKDCLGPLSPSDCLSRQSLILRHVREMTLKNCLKIKLLFNLSVARSMLLEELRIKECHSMTSIVTDVGNDESHVTCGSVFPRLKFLSVQDCSQMQYMLGQDHEEHNNDIEIHIYLPELEQLTFSRVPKLISTCSINYNATYPSLKEFCLEECPEFTINSISDFIFHLGARQLADTSTEDIGKMEKHFQTLEKLCIENSDIKGIFSLEELPIIGQQMSSASVLRSLPQLTYLEINNCEALQRIVEEDDENQSQTNPYSRVVSFPKLVAVVIKCCHSLKSLISVTTFREFPKLELMIIKEASQLDDMFRSEQGDGIPEQKLRLPKLKYLVLMQLPNLVDLSQQMELQNVTYSIIQYCPKLSFDSTTTLENFKNILEDSNIDHEVHRELFEIFDTIMEEAENENPMSETIPQSPIVDEVQDVEVQSAPQRELPCSQIIDEADKEIVAAHDSRMETSSIDLEVITMPYSFPSAILRSKKTQSTKETVEQSLLECPKTENATTTIWLTNSEPSNPSLGPLLIPLQKESSQSPQLVEKQSIDEQITMDQGTIRETNSFNGTPDEHSNLTQNVKISTNGSVSEVVLNKTALAVPSFPELDDSALALISPTSETNVTCSISLPMQRMSSSLLEDIFSKKAKVDHFSNDTENSSSSLILKDELCVYLNMSLEDIIDNNVYNNVERIVNSLAKETTDAFQRNILKDFTNRLKIFKEGVPKAMSTLQSSSEFMSNYENLNMELKAKLNEGQEKIENLETKLSETLAKECTIDMKIKKLINQKNEIVAQKNFLASQLDMYTKVVSKDYENWKGLGEELNSCSDRWLESKEDLAHANASWKILKEILLL
ncbi:uncharacterized protein [Cicer arietinum]|uniref:uncharacterized protein isoform X2 n=1 Tax=Cicer arietinum TaxID=3827 RepID=UPI003CC5D21B